jgi:thymidylate synthase ThyX
MQQTSATAKPQTRTDNEQRVFVMHDLHPEDCAMLQALYSRSPASVLTHLDKVKEVGAGKFMSRFYVGYGHASIGDCGVTTVFVENVSMLACKAIQDNPLYSGQEASTRYLDFSAQPMVDPYDHPYTTAILNTWMSLYHQWLPVVTEALKKHHPYDAAAYKSEKSWLNTVEVRAFDIMRAFLPVGTTTLFSWTTNLRQARERLMLLKSHPLTEVRDMARRIYDQMVEKYPHSFSGEEFADDSARYAERDAFNRAQSVRDNFQSAEEIISRFDMTGDEIYELENGGVIVRTSAMDIDGLNRHEKQTMEARPRGGVLSRRFAAYGNYNLAFMMDFGSYRDLQRHRNGICPLPLIDGHLGMYTWYMDELKRILTPADFSALYRQTQEQFEKIQNLEASGLSADRLKTQYLFPMGVAVPVSLSYSLPQMVYVGELRSGKTVHPSLRPLAQQLLRIVARYHPSLKLYGDMDADSWTEKRGDQTITEKTD